MPDSKRMVCPVSTSIKADWASSEALVPGDMVIMFEGVGSRLSLPSSSLLQEVISSVKHRALQKVQMDFFLDN